MPTNPDGGLRLFGVLTAVAAMVLSTIAIIVTVANDDAEGALSKTASAQAVTLSDFSITPDAPAFSRGEAVVLDVTNDGPAEHNLTLADTDQTTGNLGGGESAKLDLGKLEDGTYRLVCTIAGHEAAGMTADLVVGGSDAGAGLPDEHAGHSDMSFQEMDRVMGERTAAFPAKTEGKGVQLLEPRIGPDGTKVFELTASVVDWEVEPGKVVEGWAYNGQIPGPTIKVAVGDRVRIVLKNELPESTSIHFHGIRVPNSEDGVPDITQKPVAPGQTYTYEFTAREPAVGIYHSHHDAARQVPNGLFAPFLVGDLSLPPGVTLAKELPMVLNDAGTIGFSLNGKSFPATEPITLKRGEYALVHYLNEGLQAHPMHLHGPDQLVIAKDGNPLPEPYLADTINVAPGERYSVLVHGEDPGTWAWHCHILTHAESETGMFGMVTALIVS